MFLRVHNSMSGAVPILKLGGFKHAKEDPFAAASRSGRNSGRNSARNSRSSSPSAAPVVRCLLLHGQLPAAGSPDAGL